ncbi:hydroxyacid dehydrogenase [Aliiruegeria sabulilitoris]|uniref:hydroxyacid dehydrogenase n=1 Tax=Aliiruegeria sabulilitoris TaxID=1510458 RepID=UPI000837782F|nr:hydroxyacid dehydrogenase [Aliiruegeria sabulilitoris]NDR57019.1 hydroxyacid dehydrogenase [Pseudoruegeria sp. M32A2M]
MTVLITEFMDEGAVAALKSSVETQYLPDLADRQGDIPAMMAGIKALIVRNRTQVTPELLAASSDLKTVGRLGVGLDNINLPACSEKGVEVIPATGANTISVAEYVVTNALILMRDAYQAKLSMLKGGWPRMACSGREVGGKTLGLIGFGGIARETARLARGLGMDVCATDPLLPADDPAWEGVECLDLEKVLAKADIVSLHVPLLDTTRHMINATSLGQMKQGSVLINAARGGVVDEAALVEAIKAGRLAGAALDCFETEPLTEEAAEKFRGCENLILTPHIAGVTEESNVRVSTMIADLVLDRLDKS